MSDMDVERQVNPPKTHKGKKILEDRGPLLVENDKKTMFVKGANTSQVVNDVLSDLYKTRRQNALMMNKKNPILPFEDTYALEGLMKRHDTSLFVYGSHNKKRPHNIVFGRTYDGRVLDMIEFGVVKFKKLCQFKPTKVALGSKPCLIFNGDVFEKFPDWAIIQNYFCDFFCTTKTRSINLQGLEYIVSITAVEPDTILLRSYEVEMKKSGTNSPRVELVEIGISLDLKLRRTKLAAPDARRLALKQPKAAKIGKTKNISHIMDGTKMATVHMTKQDMAEMPQSRMKGVKRKEKEKGGNVKTKKVKPSDSSVSVSETPVTESMDTS